jgi:hypothetical protein
LGASAERGYQAAAVAGAGGEHDVGRVDVVEGDGGEAGVHAVGAQAGRDDGDGLPGGDELDLVLDGVNERAVGGGGSVGPGVNAPVGVPGGVGQPGDRFVGNVGEGD